MGNWKFLGSYFTNIETVLASATPRGSLTLYPLDFTLAEHVENEWTWKTLQLVYDIDVTWNLTDFTFSDTITDTQTAGTDWDVLVPSDLATTGGRLLSIGTVPSQTIGDVSVQVFITFQIDDNFVVEGTSTYTRSIVAGIAVRCINNVSGNTDDTYYGTDEDLGSGVTGTFSLLSEAIDYSTSHTANSGDDPAVITINNFTGSISATYAEPADIP